MKTHRLLWLLLFLILAANLRAEENPLLAKGPEAPAEEKEVIALLQTDSTSLDGNGLLEISVYNPTIFTLATCVIRLKVPALKIERIYFSDSAIIPPFQVGYFRVQTRIPESRIPEGTGKRFTTDIIRLKYSKVPIRDSLASPGG